MYFKLSGTLSDLYSLKTGILMHLFRSEKRHLFMKQVAINHLDIIKVLNVHF